jgi:endonuclease YncB( thermonuclease family)
VPFDQWFRFWFVALTLFVPALSVCAQSEFTDETPRLKLPNFDSLESGIVLRILDENTVLVRVGINTERYELLGVPEFYRTQKSEATIAIDALRRMMLNERVLIQTDPLGKHLKNSNRLAAFFYREPDRMQLNLELIRQGYMSYSSVGMSQHRETFEYYHDRAKELERGIWAKNVQDQSDGMESKPSTEPSMSADQQVYITLHGKKYHRNGCQHLSSSAKLASRDQIQKTHQPCKTCRPDG